MMNKEDQLKNSFLEFCQTIAKLRDPKDGCPWDLKQTHATLRKYMIEEAYEASTEMSGEVSSPELCDELGDVLLQVVLNAQLAQDQGAFDIGDVVDGINEKMIRRHPHVFDPKVGEKSESEVRRSWEEIKKSEKKNDKKSYFDEAKKVSPANLQAEAIGKLAAKIAFDWGDVGQVLNQLRSEIDELQQAVSSGKSNEIEAELGDVFFTCSQVSRHLKISPEVAAHSGNLKFLNRFKKLESIAEKQNIDIETADRNILEDLWQQAKSPSK